MPASAVNSRSFASDKALSMKRFPPCGTRFSIMPCTFRKERLSAWKVLKSKARFASEPYVIMPTWLFLGPTLKNATRALAKSSTCNDRNRIINTEERVIYATYNGIGGATEDWVEASTPTSLLAAHLTTMPSDPYTVRKVQVKPYFVVPTILCMLDLKLFRTLLQFFWEVFAR